MSQDARSPLTGDASTLRRPTPDPSYGRFGTTSRGRVRRTRAVTVLAAVIGALLGWALDRLLGAHLVVRTGSDTHATRVVPAAVVLASLVAGLLAWLLLALLEQLTRRARTAWTGVAVATLVVSLIGPLAARSGGDRAGLALLHVIVGVVLVVGLRRTVAPAPGVARRDRYGHQRRAR